MDNASGGNDEDADAVLVRIMQAVETRRIQNGENNVVEIDQMRTYIHTQQHTCAHTWAGSAS